MIARRTIAVMMAIAAALPIAGAGEACRDCDRQMRKITEAIQAWRRAHGGEYPAGLSDLAEAGLLPRGGEICPHVLAEAEGASASHALQSSKGNEKDRAGAYEYEMSKRVLEMMIPALAPERDDPFLRFDQKSILLRREHAEQVPILRCRSHRGDAPEQAPQKGWRNLTTDGSVYWSGELWEQEFLDDVPYVARSEAVLFGLQGPPFCSGKEVTVPGALDLSPWVNSFGDHGWWWSMPLYDWVQFTQPTPNLSAFFKGEHGRGVTVGDTEYWADGLVQLQGRALEHKPGITPDLFRYPGMEAFPWERRDLPVGRKFTQARWLQGTVWRVKDEETVAGFLDWEFDDGEVQSVPIVVGEGTSRFWASDGHLEKEEGFPEPAWSVRQEGVIDGGPRHLRLYEQRWDNPRKDQQVLRVHFRSNRECTASPFIVAITLKP